MQKEADLKYKMALLLHEFGVDTMLELPDHIVASYVVDELIALRNMRSLLKSIEDTGEFGEASEL
jgi:predicted transcriptional regulator